MYEDYQPIADIRPILSPEGEPIIEAIPTLDDLLLKAPSGGSLIKELPPLSTLSFLQALADYFLKFEPRGITSYVVPPTGIFIQTSRVPFADLRVGFFPDAGFVLAATPVLEELLIRKPEGTVLKQRAPTSFLSIFSESFDIAMVTERGPTASIQPPLLPIGVFIRVFYTPALAINDGHSFLILDDGGRLRIGGY